MYSKLIRLQVKSIRLLSIKQLPAVIKQDNCSRTQWYTNPDLENFGPQLGY